MSIENFHSYYYFFPAECKIFILGIDLFSSFSDKKKAKVKVYEESDSESESKKKKKKKKEKKKKSKKSKKAKKQRFVVAIDYLYFSLHIPLQSPKELAYTVFFYIEFFQWCGIASLTQSDCKLNWCDYFYYNYFINVCKIIS